MTASLPTSSPGADVPAVDHDDWTGCRPVVLVQPGADPADTAVVVAAVQQVWTSLPDEDRQAYHRVTCQRSRARLDLAVAHRIAEQMQLQMEQPP
jgi:hypothetical protein